MKRRKPSIFVGYSSCLSLFLSTSSTAATYIFTALTCTTTTIGVEPCSLNAETLYDFQHSHTEIFEKFQYFANITEEKGDRGVKGGPKTSLLSG
jgi:hypothetical protein